MGLRDPRGGNAVNIIKAMIAAILGGAANGGPGPIVIDDQPIRMTGWNRYRSKKKKAPHVRHQGAKEIARNLKRMGVKP